MPQLAGAQSYGARLPAAARRSREARTPASAAGSRLVGAARLNSRPFGPPAGQQPVSMRPRASPASPSFREIPITTPDRSGLGEILNVTVEARTMSARYVQIDARVAWADGARPSLAFSRAVPRRLGRTRGVPGP